MYFWFKQKTRRMKRSKTSCSIAVLREIVKLLSYILYKCVCVWLLFAWVFGCVYGWAHVAECWSLSIKGHTVTFHCEIFMIRCECFLAKLVAARHVLYYSSEFVWPIPDFLCQKNGPLKRIMSMAPSTLLWFWLISFQPK